MASQPQMQLSKTHQITLDFTTQRLSNRQYSILRECKDSGGLSLERALELSQLTFGSIALRNLVAWDKKIGVFNLTPLGLTTLEQFGSTDVSRMAIDRPLSTRILSKNRELNSLSKTILEENHKAVQSRKKEEAASRQDRRR